MSSPNLTLLRRLRCAGVVQNALHTVSNGLSRGFIGISVKAAFNRLSIPRRLALMVFVLVLPLNLVIVGVIWDLVNRAKEAQRTGLLYTARSIAAGVDAEIGKYMALAESLARSPELLDGNLDAFAAEARREFPAGRDTWVLVADVNGQQLMNTLVSPGQPLPKRQRRLTDRFILATTLSGIAASCSASRMASGTGSSASMQRLASPHSTALRPSIASPVSRNSLAAR